MSFITPITGYIPNSQFVITETNLSCDNVSCNNLSATNASIVNLTTTTFSPVNINTSNIIADTISATSISVTTINSSLSTTVDLIATSGTVNTLFSGTLNVVGLAEADQVNCGTLASAYIINLSTITTDRVLANTLKGNISENLIAGVGINLSTVSGITTITNTGIVTDPLTIGTINVSNLSCDQFHVSNISLDGTLGGNTANLLLGNILTVNSSSVNTENLRIEDSANTNFTNIVRGNNITNFIGTYDSTPNDYNFFTKVFTSNQPILQLLGVDDKVVVNKNLSTQSIDSTAIHCTGQTLTAILSSDIINSNYEMYLSFCCCSVSIINIHLII